MKTKIVSNHTADSKPAKQEVNGTVILPPLVFPAANTLAYFVEASVTTKKNTGSETESGLETSFSLKFGGSTGSHRSLSRRRIATAFSSTDFRRVKGRSVKERRDERSVNARRRSGDDADWETGGRHRLKLFLFRRFGTMTFILATLGRAKLIIATLRNTNSQWSNTE
jgi:hypothetical protein